MAKIILNGRYGGFKWSNRGIVEILKRKGVLDKTTFLLEEYNKPDIQVSESEFIESDDWRLTFRVDDEAWEGFDERTDPDAIAVFEEKGSRFCSGRSSNLYMEEYDEDLFVASIDEYDGAESLDLIPNLTEAKVRNCHTIDEVVELLRKTGALRQDS